MNLREHNARVRVLADRMPADMLSRAVCAIGYRANAETGITSGFSVQTLANESRKHLGGSYAISARQLNRAIQTLHSAGVIRVQHSPPKEGKRQPNVYHIDYGYADIDKLTEAHDMGKRQRRRDRWARQEWLESAVENFLGDAAETSAAEPMSPELITLAPVENSAAVKGPKCAAFDGPCDADPWSVTDGKPVCYRCGRPMSRRPVGHKA